jgi:predicted small lipoprotein YifL
MSLRPVFIRRVITIAAAAAIAAPLAACGKMGELERPSPLAKSDRATTRRADDQQRKGVDAQPPVDTVDSRDRSIDPAPPRTLPIPGSLNDPNRPPPAQGSLPDPYSNPR